jgi:hypothetical protein
MSPTNFCPGMVAVKSRLTRSGMSARLAACWVVPSRERRGWQGTRSSSRIRSRTTSGWQRTPQRASWAWTRRYPYRPSLSVNALTITGLSRSRHCAVPDAGRRSPTCRVTSSETPGSCLAALRRCLSVHIDSDG